MRRPGIPLFLARRPYRRRRRMDAARVLPVFGLFLMMLPMLWEPVAGAERRVAQDGVYLFAVWAGLILCARILAGGLVDPDPPPPPAPPAGRDGD
jgi:hypothetical protein